MPLPPQGPVHAEEFFQELEGAADMPEKRLLIAVLQRAIIDFTDPKAPKIIRWRAAKWLFSPSMAIGSLYWICEWLSEEPMKLRVRVRELVKNSEGKPTVVVFRVDRR